MLSKEKIILKKKNKKLQNIALIKIILFGKKLYMHSARFFAGEATLENVFSGPLLKRKGIRRNLELKGNLGFPAG